MKKTLVNITRTTPINLRKNDIFSLSKRAEDRSENFYFFLKVLVKLFYFMKQMTFIA
jgi:hypothetical protein